MSNEEKAIELARELDHATSLEHHATSRDPGTILDEIDELVGVPWPQSVVDAAHGV